MSSPIIQYSVLNQNNQIINQWLSTQFDATHYEPGFGLPQRVLNSDEQGNVVDTDGSIPDLSKALSTQTSTDQFGQTIHSYTMPAQFTITSLDITAQLAAQASLQKGLEAQSVGAMAVAQVYVLNEAKFAAGTLTTQDFQTILADTTLQTIERLLWNGSLATAKAMIQAYSSPYFSADDIASVVAILDNSGLI
jgi:hypothetical protein